MGRRLPTFRRAWLRIDDVVKREAKEFTLQGD
jgi:hypothetical protein